MKKVEKIVPGKGGKAVRIRELTQKQRKFVDAYLGEANGNGVEAAKIAGYEGGNLSVVACVTLKKPNVRLAIDERTKDDGSIATRDERQAFLTRVMRTEHRKMPERMKAVELLCRMHGDFIERHTVDMTVGRAEQKAEIVNFLDQLSARASVGTVDTGSPVVQVINATAEAVVKAEEGAQLAGTAE